MDECRILLGKSHLLRFLSSWLLLYEVALPLAGVEITAECLFNHSTIRLNTPKYQKVTIYLSLKMGHGISVSCWRKCFNSPFDFIECCQTLADWPDFQYRYRFLHIHVNFLFKICKGMVKKWTSENLYIEIESFHKILLHCQENWSEYLGY